MHSVALILSRRNGLSICRAIVFAMCGPATPVVINLRIRFICLT